MSVSEIIDASSAIFGNLGFYSRAGAVIAIGNGNPLNTWNTRTNFILPSFYPAGPHSIGFWDGSQAVSGNQWVCASGVSDDGTLGPAFEGGRHRLVMGKLMATLYAPSVGSQDEMVVGQGPSDVCISAAPPSTLLCLGNKVTAKAGSFTVSATGNHAVTGLGFQPDLVLFLGCDNVGTTGADGDLFMFGAMDASGNQWVVASRSYFFSGSVPSGAPVTGPRRWSTFLTDACLLSIGSAGYTLATSSDQLGHYVSMDSGGFTVNMTVSSLDSASNPATVAYLALKAGVGGNFKVGNAAQPTSTGVQTVTGVGFQPDSLLFASAGRVAAADPVAPFNGSIGLGSSISFGLAAQYSSTFDTFERSTWGGGEGNLTSTFSRCGSRYWESALAFGQYGSTLLAEATMYGWDPDGFRLNWTTADATARAFGWIAFDTETTFPYATGGVETLAATNTSCGNAQLRGNADPNGGSVDFYFDYGTTTAYGTSVFIGTLTGSVVFVSANITGLTPGVTYHHRIRAVSGGCQAFGADMSFVESVCIPIPTTNPATDTACSTATLNGSFDKNGTPNNGTWYFEWGTTIALGSVTTGGTYTAGSGVLAVSEGLTTLVPGATYYYKLVVTYGVGPLIVEGSIVSFTQGSCHPYLSGRFSTV